MTNYSFASIFNYMMMVITLAIIGALVSMVGMLVQSIMVSLLGICVSITALVIAIAGGIKIERRSRRIKNDRRA